MAHRLGRYCEGVMEAGWLLAVILAPLFFNTYSARIFEPDKIALVRGLALVVSAAWLIAVISAGGTGRGRRAARPRIFSLHLTPVALAAGAFLSTQLISTLLSVSPRESLLGSYERMQGTLTTLSYLTIFAAIATHVRRRAQVDRLIIAVILTSLPVSLHGLLQHFHRDPLPWSVDAAYRIHGSLGNAIFFAAYLVLPTLLCLGRLVLSLRAFGSDERRASSGLRSAGYAFLLAVNVLSIYFSFSRGPWLGLLAGSYVFGAVGLALFCRRASHRSGHETRGDGVLARLARRSRGLLLLWIFATAVGAATLLIFNVSGGPLERYRKVPGVGRFGQILDEFEMRTGTGRVRLLLWSGVIEMIAPHAPLGYPDGSEDRWNVLRPLLGYGPETLRLALPRFHSPELGRLEGQDETPDRAHNEIFDTLATTGLVGLAVHLALWTTVFHCGLKWLGLTETRRRRGLAVALMLGGAGVGATVLALWGGLPLAGVGLPFGLLLGLVLFLLFLAFRPSPTARDQDGWHAITLTSILAALAAHFTEVHLGIGTVSTRSHFWALAGLMLAMGHALSGPGGASVAPRVSRPTASARGAGRTDSLPGVLIACALLVTLGYDFLTPVLRNTSALDVLARSLTFLPQKHETSLALLLMISCTWLLAGVVAYLEENAATPGPLRWGSLAGTLAGLFAVSAPAWLFLGALAGRIAVPGVEDSSMILLAERMSGPLSGFCVLLSILLFVWAASLSPRTEPAERTARVGLHPTTLFACAVLALLTIGLVVTFSLRSLRADTIFKAALQVEGRLPDGLRTATEMHRRAVRLAPREDHYRLFLGRTLRRLAGAEHDPVLRQALLSEAESQFETAQRLSPLEPEHTASLARVDRDRARITHDPALRAEHGRQASENYARAVRLSPGTPRLYNEWALLLFQVLGDAIEAQRKLDSAFRLDGEYAQTHQVQGDLYAWRADPSRNADPQSSRAFYDKAIDATKQAIRLTEKWRGNTTFLRQELARIRTDAGRVGAVPLE